MYQRTQDGNGFALSLLFVSRLRAGGRRDIAVGYMRAKASAPSAEEEGREKREERRILWRRLVP
jgi:hypothetical protein